MKYIKFFILSSLLLCVSSCEDFLEVEQTGEVSPEALLINDRNAEIYLVGTYDALRNLDTDFDGWFSIWGTLAADEIGVPNWSGSKPVFLHSLAPTDAVLSDMWSNLYSAVNRINSAIDRIGAMTDDQIDADVKDQFIGEARFMRALIYFALVSTWENIPLVTQEVVDFSDLKVSQATPKAVYESIEQDLLFAESVLEEGQGGGRVTKGAAQALLGKVYLQMTGFPLLETDKFALAEQKLNEVITSGVYSLEEFYPDVFALDNEQNNEMVFAVGYHGPALGQGGRLGVFYGPQGTPENGAQGGFNFVVNWELAGNEAAPPEGGAGSWPERNNFAFAQPYDQNDIRARNNIAKHNVNTGQQYTPEDGLYNDDARQKNPWNRPQWRPWKWHAPRGNTWGAADTPYDQPVIRYADVLLMYAEALNGQGKLTQDDIDNTVNLLRARARRFPPEAGEIDTTGVAPDMVLASQDENADEILSERRKELCFEGWRRNDLIRFGKYAQAISVTQPSWSNAGNPAPQFEPHEIRWPIPLRELQLNPNLQQNEGY
jgi:hypothetical protein